jgi:hypothetical protein
VTGAAFWFAAGRGSSPAGPGPEADVLAAGSARIGRFVQNARAARHAAA